MIGKIKLGSKRAGSQHKPNHGDTVIDIDRKNPILGNPHFLEDINDSIQRERVVKLAKQDLEKDLEVKGPKTKALLDIAILLESGKNVTIMCWCIPKSCHGDAYIQEVNKILKERNPTYQIPQKNQKSEELGFNF